MEVGRRTFQTVSPMHFLAFGVDQLNVFGLEAGLEIQPDENPSSKGQWQ